MIFWLIAGAVTLLVAALLVLALMRPPRAADESAMDVQLYKEQLSEVDRDVARGVLDPSEAERARLEISRRLLDADKRQGDSGVDIGPGNGRFIGGLVCVALLAGAGGLYSQLGATGYNDQPLTSRIADAEAQRATRPSQTEFEAQLGQVFTPQPGTDPKFLNLMVQLREATQERPDDLEGFRLLARNEAVLGNFKAAHPAQSRVIALLGADATVTDYALLADLLVLAADGYVSPEAETAVDKAIQLDPINGTARYYKGLMFAQNERPDLAFAIWQNLLAQSRPEAPWVPAITGQISQVAELAGVRYTPPAQSPALPGPSAEDMDAAAEMSVEDRMDMIRGMVDGLAERLANDGGSAEEWARLITALGVLDETERAAAIWAEAQTTFAGSADDMAALRAAAQRAGVAE